MRPRHALIVAEKDKVKETLRALLDLAKRPQDVSYPGQGRDIYVPEYLADAYLKAVTPRRKRAKEKED